jgi:hypothetical protein
MSHLPWIAVIGISFLFLSITVAAPYLTAAENLAKRMARRKRAVVLVVGAMAILGRLALLEVYPVPVPEVHDEFSYLLAADTFAHGKLSNPPHPMALYLDTFHVFQQPSYMSIFPPAQGFFLAVGQRLGHPWIGVLISVAFMCGAVTWMLQGWFAPEWALLGGVLLCLRLGLFSYWVNSYWGGAVAAAGGALVMGALPRILHQHRTRDALVMGLGLAVVANSRPLEGLVFSVPVGVALLVWLRSIRAPGFAVTGPRIAAPLACVLGLTLAFMAYYNWRVTANPFLLPHELYMHQQCNCPVFAWQKFPPPMHYTNDQFDYFYNVHVRNRYLPSWPVYRQRSWQAVKSYWHFFLGGLLSVPFIALPWVMKDRRTRLMFIQSAMSGAALFAVPYVEPHYLAPMVATALALWLQSLRHLRHWKLFGRPVGIGLSRMVVLLALANVPWYTLQMHRNGHLKDWDWSNWRAHIAHQLDATPGQHLVVVHYEPQHINRNHDYSRYFCNEWVYNGADIDNSKIVWAREPSEQSLKPLLDYFHGREVWLLEADASPPRLTPYPGK